MLRDKGVELHLMDIGGGLNSSVSRLVGERDWKKLLAEMHALSAAGKSTRLIADAMEERALNISHNTVYRCLTERRKTNGSAQPVASPVAGGGDVSQRRRT